ncbi:MAG: hypothetical protein HLX43_12505 [Bacillus sp. (in: Bacteria)]|nr:hypothetical protein [Bacillus sp. (in: firmicutes)]
MKQIIQFFLNSLARKKQLRMLLPAVPVTVSFRDGDECCLVAFSKERCVQLETGNADFELEMALRQFEQLLSRRARLGTFLKMGELRYRGTYRHFLLLESLFWLAGTPQPAPKSKARSA